MNRTMKISILILTLLMLLCGCGAQKEENPEPGPLPELYEQTGTEGIYNLNRIDTEGYNVQDAQLKDGYVLLRMKAMNETGTSDAGKLVLFPLQRPERAVSLSLNKSTDQEKLLTGGRVLITDYNGNVVLYDSGLKESYRGTMPAASYLGASDDGALWFLTEDVSFEMYRNGEIITSIPSENLSHGSYAGERDGIVCFEMYDGDYKPVIVAVDLKTGTTVKNKLLCDSYDLIDGILSYEFRDQWILADMTDPLMITEFTKPYPDDRADKADGHYLLAETVDYKALGGTAREEFHVYDMVNGNLVETRKGSEFSDLEVTVLDFDRGMVLLKACDDKLITRGMYLWEIREPEGDKPEKNAKTVNYHVDQKRVDELIGEIYVRFGVRVYYDKEHLLDYGTSNYELMECTDTELLGYTLCKLKECMAEYPAGFFEDVKGERFSEVVFYLCDKHVLQEGSNLVEIAAGTVNYRGENLYMSLDVHYWPDLRQTFLHECTHMMQYRLRDDMAKIGKKGFTEYWTEDLNSPDCPLIQSYVWEDSEENLKGIYNDEDPENAWYIDRYAKNTVNEDQARVMEHGIHTAGEKYFTSPHIDRKSRFMMATIRETFPCVKESENPVFWEKRTGIVDLYSEFADFTK